MTSISGNMSGITRKAYPQWGRALTENDIGKYIVRTFPQKFESCIGATYDWSYVPDPEVFPLEFRALKLTAIKDRCLEILDSLNFVDLLTENFNDNCWLTIDEFRNKIQTNPDQIASLPWKPFSLSQGLPTLKWESEKEPDNEKRCESDMDLNGVLISTKASF